MTRHLAVLIEYDLVHLVVNGALVSVPWRAAPATGDDADPAADALVRTLEAAAPGATALTLVIGGAFLEIAQPALPPMAETLRRRALHFQADRYFALPGPLAMGFADAYVLAAEATRLRAWRAALERWAPVVAVTSLPQAVRLAAMSGNWYTPAAPGEQLFVRCEGGAVQSLRRTRSAPAPSASPLDVTTLLRRLTERPEPDAADQLLDLEGEQAWHARTRRAWWRSGLVAAGMLLVCAWSLERAQVRARDAARARVAQLEAEAAPALAAAERLRRAETEARTIDELTARTDAPSAVLARLGALLPADAFVQRLEWDGTQWRIDGSASDAAALVPLLDADAAIDAVTSLAPSTRFVDNGRARSSFSIGFRVTPVRAAPATRAARAGGAPNGS